MRAWIALLAACSFVAVHGPPAAYDSSKSVPCTDSDVVPSIDSIAGVLLIAGAGGGEVVTQATDHKIDHYELLYGLPLLVAGIVYLVAASGGTDKVEKCKAIREGQTTDCDGCPDRVP